MTNWKEEKENLEKFIYEEQLPYDKIGEIYGCSGSNIRKVAKQLGIELPQRRKINPCETFNKGIAKKYYCLNCGKELNSENNVNRSHKYCSIKCQRDYQYKDSIKMWLSGEDSGTRKNNQMASFIRRYLFELHNSSCQICGWHEINPITNKVPLEIHHIDGDCSNNRPENLQLLCPNHHSLTPNYGILNKDKSTRYFYGRINKEDDEEQ